MVKYYKKITVEKDWTPPVLTSNGVLGGDSFAVYSPSVASSAYSPFLAFDGSVTTNAVAVNGKNHYIMYFPEAVNISNIKSVGYHDIHWLLNSYRIAYSDDNITYTNATNILTATNNEINANIEKSVGYHKYWKIIPITCSNSGWSVKELYVQAQGLRYTWTKCTKEEYDQLPENNRKIVADIYSAFARDLSSGTKLYGVLNIVKQQVVKKFNSLQYSAELQAQEGINGVKFSPSNLYGMTNLSSYINIPQNQKVIFELPDNLVRVNYVHHKGYTVGQVMPASNINQVDVSNDGVKWTTVATYSIPTYGIAGDVTNQLDLPKIKYIRFNFWFHGSGFPSYYGSGGVGSVYINYHVKDNGKEKEVVGYYLGGR